MSPRSEIGRGIGLKDEQRLREHNQQITMSPCLIEMTILNKPRSRLKKYQLTDVGKRMLIKLNKE